MGYHRAIRKTVPGAIVACGLGVFITGPAAAGDPGPYKPAAGPMPVERRCSLSANVALTSDYVFRGYSQTDESPAIQGGFDAACGRFYAGAWGSNLDFGAVTTLSTELVDVADIELDFYAGFRPTIGKLELDIGVIYYHYPNAFDGIGIVDALVTPLGELDYWEFKFGWGYTVLRDVAVSTTVFYSPEYTGETGDNVVLETALEKPLGHGFALSGTIGSQWGDVDAGGNEYTYWNIGLSKEFHDKFTFDVRYWDTDNNDDACEAATVFQCDARVVATLSASF